MKKMCYIKLKPESDSKLPLSHVANPIFTINTAINLSEVELHRFLGG
jgi:hypothetical protein